MKYLEDFYKPECVAPCEKHIFDCEEYNPHCHCCGLLMREDKPEKKLKFIDSVVIRGQWGWITLWNEFFN